MAKKPSTKRKRSNGPTVTGITPFPYRKARVRIPREISSAASLWLDFFQQFCDIVLDREMPVIRDRDDIAIARAHRLADSALEAFQNRFPGVHP